MVDWYSWQRAWTWWLGEIRALLPVSLLEQWMPKQAVWEIALLAGGAVEIRDAPANGTYSILRRFPSVAAFLAEEVSQDVAPKARRTFVSVDVDRCFVHRLSVPATARPQLPSLLRLELLRITPFALRDVLTGWREESAGPKGLTVTHIVLKRDYVQPIVGKLAEAGVAQPRIFVRDGHGNARPIPMSEAEPATPMPQFRIWRRLAVASCVAACASLAILAAETLARRDRQLEAIDARIEAATKKAAVVRNRLKAMEDTSRQAASLAARKQAQVPVLAIWAELTTLLPDDAWLSNLTVKSNEISIAGAARSAEPLISVLDKSPLFQGVNFEGPVTALPGDNRSRFSIHMTRAGFRAEPPSP